MDLENSHFQCFLLASYTAGVDMRPLDLSECFCKFSAHDIEAM